MGKLVRVEVIDGLEIYVPCEELNRLGIGQADGIVAGLGDSKSSDVEASVELIAAVAGDVGSDVAADVDDDVSVSSTILSDVPRSQGVHRMSLDGES